MNVELSFWRYFKTKSSESKTNVYLSRRYKYPSSRLDNQPDQFFDNLKSKKKKFFLILLKNSKKKKFFNKDYLCSKVQNFIYFVCENQNYSRWSDHYWDECHRLHYLNLKLKISKSKNLKETMQKQVIKLCIQLETVHLVWSICFFCCWFFFASIYKYLFVAFNPSIGIDGSNQLEFETDGPGCPEPIIEEHTK